MTVQELAQRIGATVRGDGATVVSGCAGLQDAGPRDVSFLANRKYVDRLASTKAAAIVLSEADSRHVNQAAVLIADNPYFAFREAIVALHGQRPQPSPGVSPQALVAPDATIGRDCAIEAFAWVGPGARVGDRSVIHPHTYIGPGATVGRDCILYPNVTIYERCSLGDRVIVHSGAVIGADGYGYALHEGVHHKIPQVGIVRLEDDVEVGANSAIDRAAVGVTTVGQGTKIDNQVTIGHGATIGRNCLLVAQVGIAGSTQVGDDVSMGGQVGVAGHLRIGDGVQLAAKSGVMDDIPPGQQYGGQPALPMRQTRRIVISAARLPDLAREVKALQKRVAELEAERKV